MLECFSPATDTIYGNFAHLFPLLDRCEHHLSQQIHVYIKGLSDTVQTNSENLDANFCCQILKENLFLQEQAKPLRSPSEGVPQVPQLFEVGRRWSGGQLSHPLECPFYRTLPAPPPFSCFKTKDSRSFSFFSAFNLIQWCSLWVWFSLCLWPCFSGFYAHVVLHFLLSFLFCFTFWVLGGVVLFYCNTALLGFDLIKCYMNT